MNENGDFTREDVLNAAERISTWPMPTAIEGIVVQVIKALGMEVDYGEQPAGDEPGRGISTEVRSGDHQTHTGDPGTDS